MKNLHSHHAQPGFTLIELSIVLVIIGLLVGSVLVGQELIEAAEFRKIVRDIERYETAVYAFRDKYNCLPGDCPNATTFFGVSSTGCQISSTNSGYVTSAGGTGTCNGAGHNYIGASDFAQGDEEIGWGGGRAVVDPFQKVLFFHHLSLAGMVPGQFTGTFSTSTSSGTGFLAGVDVPLTGRGAQIIPNYEMNPKSGAVQWNPCSSSSPADDTLWYQMLVPGGEYFSVGTPAASGGGLCPFLTPIEAESMDTKYDDGKAWTGKIISPDFYGHDTFCTDDLTGGTWQGADTTRSCHLMFFFFQ